MGRAAWQRKHFRLNQVLNPYNLRESDTTKVFNITVIDLRGMTFARRMRVNQPPRSMLSMKYSVFHQPLTTVGLLEIAPYMPLNAVPRATEDLKKVMSLDSTRAPEVSLVVTDTAAAKYPRCSYLPNSCCHCERGRRCA